MSQLNKRGTVVEHDPIFDAWLVTPPNISIFANNSGYLTTEAAFNSWLSGPPDISEFTNDFGYLTSLDALTLDQSFPQTITGGMPVFDGGIAFNAFNNIQYDGSFNLLFNDAFNTNVSLTQLLNANPNDIQFDITPTIAGHVEGRLYYDQNWKTLSANIDADVTLQIGQEEHRYVYNATGSTIYNGEVVYTNGVWGGTTPNVATVALAKANSNITSQVLGSTTQDILPSSYGFVSVRGHINDLDTNGIGRAFLTTQSLFISARVGGTAGNAYTFEVIDSTGGGLTYTDTLGAIVVDLGGTTPTTADIVTLFTVTPSTYVKVKYLTVAPVVVAGVLSLANGVATAVGDTLYLSAVDSGFLTTVAPTPPNLRIRMGRLIKKGTTDGVVNIRIIPTSRVEELSNVAISTPAEGDIIVYDAATSSWKNEINAIPTYDLATMKTTGGVANFSVVCSSNGTIYIYDPTSGLTADDKYVTITGDGGDSRWLGYAGLYCLAQKYMPFICNKLIAGTDTTTYTVNAPLVLDDSYGSVVGLNITGSNQNVTLPALADSQQGQIMAIGIVSTSPFSAILQITNTNLDHEYILTPGTMVSFEFGRTKWHLMGGKNAITQLDQIGQPTYKNTQDWFNVVQSSGLISGGICSNDGVGGVNITNVLGIIKTSDSDVAGNKFFNMAGANFPAGAFPNGLVNGTNFIYIDYNGGIPVFQAVADRTTLNRTTQFVIANIFKDGNDLEIINLESSITNFSKKVVNRLIEVNGVDRVSGANVTESGTRGLQTDNGVFYYGLERLCTTGIDTGAGDFYETYVRDGAGGWYKIHFEQTVDSLKYDSNGAGGGALPNIEGITSSGGLINVEITAHGVLTDDLVHIQDCLGTIEANGDWRITKIGPNNFTLNGSAFVNAYTPGSGQALQIGLGTVTADASHHGVHWVFICTEGELYVVYGQDDYATLSAAQTAALPAVLPEYLYFNTVLAAKVITNPLAANIVEIISGYTVATAVTAPTTHNTLGGLNVGDYKHLTAAEYAGLAGIGSIASGSYSRMALYHTSPTGNALADSIPDNDASHVVASLVASHTLTSNRVYTLQDVGANASYVMTEGDQTINGIKTFGSTIVGSINGNAATVTGLSVVGGKTLTVSNTLTLSGTDSSTLNIGTGGTLGSAAYTASSAYQAASANLTSLSSLMYGSLAFVKMSAAGTFTLDTTTYQPTLVSGSNIKTINSTTLLGSGDIVVQSTLVSGSNIKTIDSVSILGSGNILTIGTRYQATPTDPVVTNSTVGLMMGLAGTITPTKSGNILIVISGDMDNNGNGNGAQVQIRTGTGTAPINGAALTGTTRGSLIKMYQNNAGQRMPYTCNAVITGLSIGTTYWIDVGLAAISGGTARIRDNSISIIEQ